MKISFLPAILLIISLASCRQNLESKSDYLSWFADDRNGLTKKQTVNGIDFIVTYRPTEVLLMQELDLSRDYSENEIKQIRSSYDSSLHFLMEISFPKDYAIKNSTDQSTFLKFFQELAFGIEDKVELITPDGIYPPAFFHYERGYELAKKERFLFSFMKPDAKNFKEITFQYKDDLFNTSVLNFTFDLKNIEAPELPIRINKN